MVISKWIPTSDVALLATITVLSLCNIALSLWLDNIVWILLSALLWALWFIRIVFSGNDDSDSPEVKSSDACELAQAPKHISIDIHNALVSKLAGEVYVAIGSLYASNGEVPDSTYESILDRVMDIINNPSILQSDEELLIPLNNKHK
jgi:hypothetical protein